MYWIIYFGIFMALLGVFVYAMSVLWYGNSAGFVDSYKEVKANLGKPLKSLNSVRMRNKQLLFEVGSFGYCNIDFYYDKMLVRYWGKCQVIDYSDVMFNISNIFCIYMRTYSEIDFIINKWQYDKIKNIVKK